MNNLITVGVREARFEDIPQIVELHDACHAGMPAEGFFVDRGDPAELAGYLRHPERRCLVAEDDRGVVGFLQANRVIELVDTVNWTRPEWRATCGGARHWHVDNVAVSRVAKGRGVGGALYDALVAAVGAESLSAYVVKAPLVNEASLAFHARAGFAAAGEFHRTSYCGVRDYRSVLLVNPAVAARRVRAPFDPLRAPRVAPSPVVLAA